MSVKIMGAIAAALLLIAGDRASPQGQGAWPGVTRLDLQRHDLSTPGREAVQATITIAPGVTAPDHSHPGEEIIYVLQGSFEYRVAGKPIRLQPGGVLFIPAGTIHSAKNIGEGNAVELATYVVEKGRPLVVPAR
ncbi:MAG TPA: cupin domain-containing protein [Allosphingosinicella sp.]|nr:cupin domain-containing protein [Allosphingosinicella sp.]